MKCPKHKGSAEVRGSRGSFSLGFCTPQLRATSKTLRSAICFCTPGGRPWLRCPRTPAYNGSPQARCPQTLACSGGPRAGAHGPPRIVEVRKHGARAPPGTPTDPHAQRRSAVIVPTSPHIWWRSADMALTNHRKKRRSAGVAPTNFHMLWRSGVMAGRSVLVRFPPLGRPLVRVSVLVIVMPHSALKHQEKASGLSVRGAKV